MTEPGDPVTKWGYIAHGVLTGAWGRAGYTGDWSRAGYEGDQVAEIQPTLERALHVLHQAASDENHPLAQLDDFEPSQAAIGLYVEIVAVGAFARIKHGEEEMSTDDLATFARGYLAVANSFWNGAP